MSFSRETFGVLIIIVTAIGGILFFKNRMRNPEKIDEQKSTGTLEISEEDRLSMNRFFKLCFFLIFGGFSIGFLGMFIHPYFGYFVVFSAVGMVLMFLGFVYIQIKYRAYFFGKRTQ